MRTACASDLRVLAVAVRGACVRPKALVKSCVMAIRLRIGPSLILLLFFWTTTVAAREKSKENLLFERLLRHNESDTLARPLLNVSDALYVNMSVHLLQILDLDSKAQSVSFSGYLEVRWKDYELTWKPEDFGGLMHVTIPGKNTWVPDIGQINSLEGQFDFSKDEQNIRLILFHTGEIRWYPAGVYKAGCQLDLTYFPFDEQKCAFTFASWTYTTDALQIHAIQDTIQVSKVAGGSQWKIIATSMFVHIGKFQPDEKDFSFLYAELVSERLAIFYVIHIILPTTVISLLSLSAFLLPCESGEKVSLGITILLAFSVFQLVLADQLPTNTSSVPILVVYLTTLIILSGISTLLSVFILNLHHMESDTILPNMARTIVYGLIAKITFYKTYHRLSASFGKNYKFDHEVMMPLGNIEDRTDSRKGRADHSNSNTNNDDVLHMLRNINAHLSKMVTQREESHREDVIKCEWKESASIIDRMFMVIYLIVLFVITASFLSIMPNNQNV
ncbi:acetylcholine receptor subunit alpha-1-B-like [Lineus longissimus]|uniref:acetylcholine receptor subunit alpha-1-B-like n=1 Tax=Lineus longissimus TaxID=88925 RepID=UPI00315DACF9